MKLILGRAIGSLPGSILDLLQDDFSTRYYGGRLQEYLVMDVIWDTECVVWASLARGNMQGLGWTIREALIRRISPRGES